MHLSEGAVVSALMKRTRVSPAELLRMADRKNYELVDGHLVEKKSTIGSSLVGSRVASIIGIYAKVNNLGYVFNADLGYQCFPDEFEKIRKPTTSFIRRERVSDNQLYDEYASMPPDLAVEVLSANDVTYEMDKKVREYLRAGVRLVWVINPNARWAMIHRPDRETVLVSENEELTGDDVLPGFHVRLGDVLLAAPIAPR